MALLTGIQYLLIEQTEEGTHTNESMLLNSCRLVHF